MLYIKSQMNLRKYVLISAFFLSVFAVDIVTSPTDNENATYALFLGCGVAHDRGPCNVLGFRIIEHTVMVFGFEVGDSWTTEEMC